MLSVLFLCTGNSCRSQMAEGWARKLLADLVIPYSAGLVAYGLNPDAVRVMAEAGVDISNHESKTLDELQEKDFDAVVTVCSSAYENCPIFPGQTLRLRQAFDDPPALAKTANSPEEALSHYRRVRDEIREYVATLPDLLQHLHPHTK